MTEQSGERTIPPPDERIGATDKDAGSVAYYVRERLRTQSGHAEAPSGHVAELLGLCE